ncbi:MAG: cob(I)yrinic acid a,c-diamide adenosyltransferase [Bacteroidota bacterium]|nr:cob(I)yrinic acid a,c-diamide adenosyltransferase [Bacteroidota bacterium]MDE2834113.1 cob(I)yrinic acid a,c-diamide adenosyltransferase [Bacteroidota bacterium]MDE2955964.1 cob(I)yrinic acid a,c-diamide adenosyltransferase [Bacteroidota bacterium]
MKVYTRTGDDGSTGLFGAGRVAKDHARIEAIGAVDETNAALGAAHAAAADQPQLQQLLYELQYALFDAGADLATPLKSRTKTRRITIGHTSGLEKAIDDLNESLDPLKHFVLPGGCELAARLHWARVVCRRAERRVVTLSRHENLNQQVVIFLNRLSDTLFVLARRANLGANVPDTCWIPELDD